MARNHDEVIFEETIESTSGDIKAVVVEKKSIGTRIKEKVSEVGDLTLRDVGKGILKVGAAAGGIALVIGGTIKLLGNKDNVIDPSEIDELEFYEITPEDLTGIKSEEE